jgi:hypothetical protein
MASRPGELVDQIEGTAAVEGSLRKRQRLGVGDKKLAALPPPVGGKNDGLRFREAPFERETEGDSALLFQPASEADESERAVDADGQFAVSAQFEGLAANGATGIESRAGDPHNESGPTNIGVGRFGVAEKVAVMAPEIGGDDGRRFVAVPCPLFDRYRFRQKNRRPLFDGLVAVAAWAFEAARQHLFAG